jgi:hypothetical protein
MGRDRQLGIRFFKTYEITFIIIFLGLIGIRKNKNDPEKFQKCSQVPLESNISKFEDFKDMRHFDK